MPFDEAQARQFDEAAEKALAELREHFESWSARSWRQYSFSATFSYRMLTHQKILLKIQAN